jgi:hypothetical protein
MALLALHESIPTVEPASLASQVVDMFEVGDLDSSLIE